MPCLRNSSSTAWFTPAAVAPKSATFVHGWMAMFTAEPPNDATPTTGAGSFNTAGMRASTALTALSALVRSVE